MIVALINYQVFTNERIRRGIVLLSEQFDPSNR